MRLAAAVLTAALCRAQAPVAAPVLGKMIDPDGSLRTLYGVAGSFTAGAREVFYAISSGCSAELCLVKTANRILGPGRMVSAPPGPAILGVQGSDAVMYFPSVKRFARWGRGRLEWLSWQVEGEVLSLRGERIAVRRGPDVWVVRPDGAILDYLGERAGPVWLLDSATLFESEDELVLSRGDGDESRFALAGVLGFSQLGPEYVQVRTAGASYALRTTPGREELLLLPVLPSPAPRSLERMGNRER